MRIASRRAAPPIIGEEWREFTRPPLYLLLALGLLLIAIAYQIPGGASLSVDVGKREDAPYLVHFLQPERNADFDYRWSGDRSWLEAPGVGRDQPLLLTARLAGNRPSGSVPAVLTVTVSGQPLAVFSTSVAASVYTVAIPARLNNNDNLIIYFDSTYFTPPGDPRKLGVAVDWLRLTAASSPSGGVGLILGGLVQPPNNVTAWLLLSLLLIYLTLRHLRVGWWASWAASAMLMLLAAALLMFDRYDLTLFALPLLVVTLSVYGLALLLPLAAAWTLTRLGAEPSATALRALMLLYLAAFAIKAGGMIHPQFNIVDQGFRAHQVQELVADPAAFWDKYQRVTTADAGGGARGDEFSMLGQWHLQVPFPYPPLVYYVLAPFGLLWPGAYVERLIAASDTTLAALAATMAFALYAIAKRGLGSGRAGVIAAAITLFAPISYLHFSDGNWPYIWGGWLAVVYIMAVVCLADRARKPLPFITLSLLAALTLTSHTAIALFTIVFVILATIVLLLTRRGGFGFPLWPLLASFIVGVALSLIYYGAYVGPILTVTLPAIVSRLGTGLGQEQRFLSVPLLTGFWPQLWAHFTAWPLPLAVAGLGLLLARSSSGNTDNSVGDGIHRFNLSIIITWALLFALFSIADLKVNLLQRHMLFALPLLGLLAGYTLVRLIQWGTHRGERIAGAATYRNALLEVIKREWFGWLVAMGLIAFMFVVGWEAWLNRVLHYVLPPGSG
jgi:hypothetical protein